ncbi:MAG: cysteine hydrolase family protein [Candidatus Aenigmatarchaeota archaeon]
MCAKALLVMDMANDYMPKDYYEEAKLPVEPIDEIFENIRTSLALARKHEIPIIFMADEHEKGDEEFNMYGEHCLKDSEGSNITDKLEILAGDRILRKSDADGFSNEMLGRVLKAKEIDEIYLIGVVTNLSIKSTALSAKERGLKSHVVKNCVSGFNSKEKGLDELEDKEINIIDFGNLEDEFSED